MYFDATLRKRAACLALWIIAHGGAFVSVLVNWEPTGIYAGLTVLYSLLLLLSVGLLWVFTQPDQRLWQRWQQQWQQLTQDRSWTQRGWWWLVGMVVLWVLPLQPAYPINALRWWLTASAALLIGSWLYSKLTVFTQRSLVFAAVAACISVSLLSLHEYPKIYVDEGINLNKAWVAAYEGIRYTPTINLGVRGVPQLVNTELNWWAVGLWLRVAGLGIFQGRLTAWLCWCVTAALVVLAARRLHNLKAAVLAGLFVGSSEIALHTAHFVRAEMYLNLLIALALVIYAQVERRGRFRESLLLGLVLAGAVTVHVYALIYCIGFGGLFTGRWALDMIRRRRVSLDRRWVGLVIGGILGALIYALLYVIPDVAAFREQSAFYYAINYGTQKPLLPTLFDRIRVIVNHFRVWYAASIPEASIVLVSLCAIALFGGKGRPLLVVFGLTILGWIGLGSYEGLTYVSVLLPIAALLVGAGLTCLIEMEKFPAMQSVWTTLLVVAMLGVSTSRAFVPQADNNQAFNRQFERCIIALQQRLPEQAVILGDPLFWLARPTFNNYGTKDLIDNIWPGRTAAEWVAWIKPDVVLWPGPVYGATADYVLGHHFTLVDVPACQDVSMIWIRPGITF